METSSCRASARATRYETETVVMTAVRGPAARTAHLRRGDMSGRPTPLPGPGASGRLDPHGDARMPAAHSGYRSENGRSCIDLTIRHSRQLFDGRDPAPFHERDLDDDAVAYLLGAAQEIPRRQ